MKKLLIFFALVSLLFSTSYPVWCYQETATEDIWCGSLMNGGGEYYCDGGGVGY
jgi:hypothetical protein